jgi:hypothetical protein
MILNFHSIFFILSILFWNILFVHSYLYPYNRSNNKIAILNNIQCIILTLFFYFFFIDDYSSNKLTNGLQMFYKYSLDKSTGINIFLGITTYLSLGYNLTDLLIQLCVGKWVYFIHHLSLLPFLIGYVYSGYFFKFSILYGLLEISSLSFNIRQVIPQWDKGHKIIYIVIRTLTTPMLLKLYFDEIFYLTLPFIVTSGISVLLLTVFNIVSIKLSIEGLFKVKEIKQK